MKIALIGYGRMGRLLDALAPEFGCEVAVRATSQEHPTAEALRGVPVAIDFSVPTAVIANVERLAAMGVHVVVGTTGWTGELPRVERIVQDAGTGLVWSPNFSVGVNVFVRVVSEAARLFAAQPEYAASAWEIHHAKKLDAPSGTMKKLLEEMSRAGYEREVDVAANRSGFHPGTHEVTFDSVVDTVTLRHTARDRTGFARGALQAARWIEGRKGVHRFEEVLFS